VVRVDGPPSGAAFWSEQNCLLSATRTIVFMESGAGAKPVPDDAHRRISAGRCTALIAHYGKEGKKKAR
jgi:hypothetical protein